MEPSFFFEYVSLHGLSKNRMQLKSTVHVKSHSYVGKACSSVSSCSSIQAVVRMHVFKNDTVSPKLTLSKMGWRGKYFPL